MVPAGVTFLGYGMKGVNVPTFSITKALFLGPISITAARCVAWRRVASDSQR